MSILTITIGYVSYTSTQLNQENYELKKKSSGQSIMIDKLNDANMKLEGKSSNLEKELEKEKSDRDRDAKEIKDLNDRLYNSNQKVEKLKLEIEKSKRDKAVKVSSRGGSNSSISTTSSYKDGDSKANKPLKQEQSKNGQQAIDASNQSSSEPSGNWITMSASAYTSSPSENGGYSVTKLGTPLRVGVVAVDPSVIPLGTKLHIEGLGTRVAEDTGGAIKGRRIDILFGSKSSAMAFGRRQVRVKIIR